MPFIGYVLVAMAAFSVIAVLFMVMREHQETEEWYVPPSGGTSVERLGHLDTTSVAEVTGTAASNSPDDETKRQIEENR